MPARIPARSLLFACLALTACHTPADSGSPADTAPEPCAFSFAILTDTHLGEGLEDHGSAGWEDEGGDGGANGTDLATAVQQTNALAEAQEDLRFVMVLGDLSDSAERSELVAARDVLDGLALPYFPLLGNHDVWPYVRDEGGGTWQEADDATGDAVLWEVFHDVFAARAEAFSSLTFAAPTTDPDSGAARPFVDYSFDVCGAHMVVTDTNTRSHTTVNAPGIGPEASLNDVPDGMWPWLQQDLLSERAARASRILVFGHHPFSGAGLYTFTEEEFDAMEEFVEEHGLTEQIGAFFGGHIHIDALLEGPAGIPEVLTAATKDQRAPRLVHVGADGEVAWE
ncbi:MAG: metallophosphoesterase [Pseudomonadota bacterium]